LPFGKNWLAAPVMQAGIINGNRIGYPRLN